MFSNSKKFHRAADKQHPAAHDDQQVCCLSSHSAATTLKQRLQCAINQRTGVVLPNMPVLGVAPKGAEACYQSLLLRRTWLEWDHHQGCVHSCQKQRGSGLPASDRRTGAWS